jgi:hypothetical protein
MRSVRIILGVCVAACALAVMAVPSLAANGEFTASSTKKTFPLKFKGENEAEMKFGNGLTIEGCEGHAKGSIATSPSETLKVDSTYKFCEAEIKLLGGNTALVGGIGFKMEFLFKGNGAVEVGSEGESEVEIGSGAIEIHLPKTGCRVSWPRQVVPANGLGGKEGKEFHAAMYSSFLVQTGNLKNFPLTNGEQEVLNVGQALKGIRYSFVGGLCEAFESEVKKDGQFEGSMELVSPASNLGFKEF